MNINTYDYWDSRFAQGDWARKGGNEQTRNFALAQLPHFALPRNFSGTMCDFGCAEGDAIPIYREHFPNAQLYGIDFSKDAIAKCKRAYGDIATFSVGTHENVGFHDVIVASNVLEHLTDHLTICTYLLQRCDSLYVTVPYKENFQPGGEHINTYDETSFLSIASYDYKIFFARGWTQYGLRQLWLNTYLKNTLRLIMGKPIVRRNRQIMFIFRRNTHVALGAPLHAFKSSA